MSAVASHAFAGRVVLVTGASGGIGGAAAAAFASAGAAVIGADVAFDRGLAHEDGGGETAGAPRDPLDEPLQRLADGAIAPVRLDVRSRAALVALADACERRGRPIDILVNGAGVVSFGSAAALDEAEWDRVVDINLKGSFLAAQAVMAAMKRSGFGRIVNVGSVVGRNGGNARPWIAPDEAERAGNVAYGVSKAGVHAMTAFLAKELAQSGITVNAVAPGPIATAMTTGLPDALRALIPVGRMGRLDDVVRAILFLADPAAGFVTGSIVDVNGGIDCGR